MKKNFSYDFEHKAIIGSKSAINRANKGLNPEYKELSEMLAAMPSFSVQIKDIKKKKDQKRYPQLTFKKMEDYIRTQFSDEKELERKIIEFKAIQKVVDAKGAKYPLMTACMRACLDQALDEIFKDWNTSADATIKIPFKV